MTQCRLNKLKLETSCQNNLATLSALWKGFVFIFKLNLAGHAQTSHKKKKEQCKLAQAGVQLRFHGVWVRIRIRNGDRRDSIIEYRRRLFTTVVLQGQRPTHTGDFLLRTHRLNLLINSRVEWRGWEQGNQQRLEPSRDTIVLKFYVVLLCLADKDWD